MRTGENIFKRKDGRWEARYVKYRDDSGKIQYGYCYGKTYSEVKNKVNLIKQPSSEHLPELICQSKDFSAYCDDWLAVNRLRLRESTYAKYESILHRYIKPHLSDYLPEQLHTEEIARFTELLLSDYGLSPKITKDILLILHSVLKYCSRRLPDRTVSADIIYPKEALPKVRVLTTEEQERFTAYLQQDMDSCKFGVLLVLLTGMRIGEVCALRWDHIDFMERSILIEATMQRIHNADETIGGKTSVHIGRPKVFLPFVPFH